MVHVLFFNTKSNLDSFLKSEVWQQGHSRINTFGGGYGDFLITLGAEPMYTSLTPCGVVQEWKFPDALIEEIIRAIIEVGKSHLDWLEKQEQQTAGSAP